MLKKAENKIKNTVKKRIRIITIKRGLSALRSGRLFPPHKIVFTAKLPFIWKCISSLLYLQDAEIIKENILTNSDI
jgi:hypothetical protein